MSDRPDTTADGRPVATHSHSEVKRLHSDPLDLAILEAELPRLTGKQLKFVLGILDGKTQTDAYRAAYDTKGSPNVVKVQAHELSRHPSIVAWLRSARIAALDRSVVTLDEHNAQTARLRELAVATGDIRAANQAEFMRAKANGLHIHRTEIDLTIREDPITTLGKLAALDHQLAERLATSLNLPMPKSQNHYTPVTIDLEPNETKLEFTETTENQADDDQSPSD